MNKSPLQKWFENAGGYSPSHDLEELRAGIAAGLLDRQDEYGMTALLLAVASSWNDGIDELLRSGADTELRYFRTGETALYLAVLSKKEPIVASLIEGKANPDAANHWGLTPRMWASRFGLDESMEAIPVGEVQRPAPRIQNAEHLAEHHHPSFKIPKRSERENLKVGQAVDLYVRGPKSETKDDTVKVRISTTSGTVPSIRYAGAVETPVERTHLPPETIELEFGPEHVASVYLIKKAKSKETKD